jgi:hypothetical protein
VNLILTTLLFHEVQRRELDFFGTECTVKNERRLLSRMLRNLIGIDLEDSKMGDYNQLEESFEKI